MRYHMVSSMYHIIKIHNTNSTSEVFAISRFWRFWRLFSVCSILFPGLRCGFHHLHRDAPGFPKWLPWSDRGSLGTVETSYRHFKNLLDILHTSIWGGFMMFHVVFSLFDQQLKPLPRGWAINRTIGCSVRHWRTCQQCLDVGKTMWKPCENHGKTMGKPWETIGNSLCVLWVQELLGKSQDFSGLALVPPVPGRKAPKFGQGTKSWSEIGKAISKLTLYVDTIIQNYILL